MLLAEYPCLYAICVVFLEFKAIRSHGAKRSNDKSKYRADLLAITVCAAENYFWK